MISTACPECTAFYESLGRCDGGCQPGCPNMFKSGFVAEDTSRLFARPQQQATQQVSQQLQQKGQTIPDPLDYMLKQGNYYESQHMRWTRRTP